MAKKTFYFDFTEAPKTVVEILKWFNEKHYDNLDTLLKTIEWDLVADELIVPKEMRQFTKSIGDPEVRLDVMKFLRKYAKQYFREAAENAEYKENLENHTGFPLVMQHVKMASERVRIIEEELAYLIDQLENSNEFTGDKFSKQAKRIAELEKKVAELEAENEDLSTQLEKYKHPGMNGKHIPEALNNENFYNIMNYLADHKIVRRVIERNEMGIQELTCYQWDASKILFGYFVTKVNDALELRGARVPYDWKVFEPAINNYGELIKEARKAFSTYNNSSSLQKNRIKNAEIIDEAIENMKSIKLPF